MCVPSCNVTLLQNGMYLRNGPGVWEVGDGSALGHLFDGYATLVRVSFRRGRAAAARVGRLQSRQGARPPAPARVRPLPHHQAGKPGGSSEGRRRARHRQGAVGQRQRRRASGRGGDGRVLCLSETTRSSAVIDPCTLATIGKFRYGDALGGVIQAGHPGRDRLRVLDAAPRPLSGQATVS